MPLQFAAGWKSIPLRSDSPAPQPLAAESRCSARAADEDPVEVEFRRSTRVANRTETRAFRPGQSALIPAALARGMFAAGAIDCADASEPERRGFVRHCGRDGRERRLTRGTESIQAY
jgi:hypothetical protein